MKAHGLTERVICLAILVGSLAAAEAVAQSDASDLLERLKHNVVSINSRTGENESQDGFGFIVSENAHSFLIVTCRHLLEPEDAGPQWPQISVKFSTHEMNDYPAELVYTDPTYDLAILEAAKRDDLPWSKKCIGSDKDIKRDVEVWFIGKLGQWYLSANPGKISMVLYNSTRLVCEGLEIAPGTSGAPIICREGIIGMITDHTGTDVEGLTIPLIRDIVEKSGLFWSLKKLDKRYRPGPYMGVGLGLGLARFKNGGIDNPDKWRTGLAMTIHLGYAVTNRLLIGFENSLYYRTQDRLVYKYDSYALVGTYYYTGRYYVKFGPSYARIKAEPLAVIETDSGLGIVGGLGAEYRLGINLTARPEFSIMHHKLDNVSAVSASVSLNLIWFL